MYAVATARGETRVAVNLMSGGRVRSDAAPAAHLRGGRAAGVAPGAHRSGSSGRFFVLLALLLFALEGLLYWRRQTGGRLGLPSRAGRSLGARPALRAPRACCVVALAKPTIPRWVDRLNVTVPAGHVGQREPGRARERVPLRRPVGGRDAAGRPGRRHRVRRGGGGGPAASRRPPSSIGPQAQVGGRGTNLAQALQLGAGHRAGRPGQPLRAAHRRPAERGQCARGGAGGQGRGRRHLLRAGPADLHAGSGRGVDGAAPGGEVRRAVPGQGGGVEPGRDAGATLAVPERRVPRLAGGAS